MSDYYERQRTKDAAERFEYIGFRNLARGLRQNLEAETRQRREKGEHLAEDEETFLIEQENRRNGG